MRLIFHILTVEKNLAYLKSALGIQNSRRCITRVTHLEGSPGVNITFEIYSRFAISKRAVT
eukprot:UN07968